MPIIPVHGGLREPVDLVLPLSKRRSLIGESADLPTIRVTPADLSTVYRFSDGTLSPLSGPMDESDYNDVLDQQCILRGGTRYAWTIPMSLPVTDAEAATLKPGRYAALRTDDGELVGVLKVGSIFDWDKDRFLERVYWTRRTDHRGAAIVLGDERTVLVGGDIETFPQPHHPEFGDYILGPRMIRAIIAQRRYEAAIALQSRNPLHRVHEFAFVFGVERLTRAGFYTGAFLSPIVGQLQGDEVDAVTRMRTYLSLKNRRLLGTEDRDEALWADRRYDINDVFHVAGLDIRMYYAGPSEALMHAIYRQNLGFTHIVIGRRHAAAPYDDGAPMWGDFDAQEIFDETQGEIHIQPMKVGFAAYFASVGKVDFVARHPDEPPLFSHWSELRDMLAAGEMPPPGILRPETARILLDALSPGSR